MQAPVIGTIMARGPVQPFEWMQPVVPNPPIAATENPATQNPGQESYEMYGLAGLQNSLSEI